MKCESVPTIKFIVRRYFSIHGDVDNIIGRSFYEILETFDKPEDVLKQSLFEVLSILQLI